MLNKLNHIALILDGNKRWAKKNSYSNLIGYSKGGYVLGFYSDPHDKTATYESVSPENMFKDRLIDDFSSLPDPTELVSKSTK